MHPLGVARLTTLSQGYHAKGHCDNGISVPGGKRPGSLDEVPDVPKSRFWQPEINQVECAHKALLKEGLDPLSFWDQKIGWGDQDSFQHVNNVRYVAFFEASRMKWLASLGEELGGPQKAYDMIKGRGVSAILKSIEVRFRRPVTYPDTLLIGYRATSPLSKNNASTDPATVEFHATAKAYSLAQQAFVAQLNEVLVWYDYDKLKKCDPGDRIRDIVNSRVRNSPAPRHGLIVTIMSSIVKVFVVSPDTRSERRFDLHITVEQLKNKLEPVTGIPATNQIISIYDSENALNATAVLSDDGKPLGFYGLKDWQVLKVEDSNPSVSLTGQLSDVSQVQKFEISDAEYAKRTDSVLAYKKIHHVGRFSQQDEAEAPISKIPTDIEAGARCEVETLEKDLHKRGTIRYVGETKFSKGTWVGVEYDEPMGKNDGSVQGERYFTCRPNYGVFVRHEKIKVGDFPVEELDLEDEEM